MAILWNPGFETTTEWPSTTPIPRPTYDGAVLGTTGRDVRVMSDVWAWITYASVWDGERIIEVAIASSDYAVYATATVDATPEVLIAVAIFREAARVRALELAEAARIDRLVEEARRVATGKDVTVVRGRKVAKGTEGRVFWMGSGRFGVRVGLELADGSRVFTALSNVEVTNPDEFLDFDDVLAA